MYYQDALKLLEVTLKVVTLDDVKKAYRKAAMKFHPDINEGGTEMMQIINNAYESLCNEDFPLYVERKSKFYDGLSDALMTVLNNIASMETGDIELCGVWIYVHGIAKTDKASQSFLKTQGFKWSARKKAWYYAPPSERRKYYGKRKLSMDEIRTFHGSERIQRKSYRKIS